MSGTQQPSLGEGTVARLLRNTGYRRGRTPGAEGQMEAGTMLDSLGPDGRRINTASSTAVEVPASTQVVSRRNRPMADVVADLASLHLGEREDITSGATIAADDRATPATEASYIQEARQLLANALQHPNELTDSTWKTQTIGVVSEVLKVASTIAVNQITSAVFQNVKTDTFEGRLIGKAAYAGGSMLLNSVTPDVISWVTRQLGGVETKIYATLDPRRSNVGSYNEIAGKTALGMAQAWSYGAISSGIYALLEQYASPDFKGLPRTAAATVPAAAIAALGAQGANAYLNRRTLKDQGVDSHDDLRPQRHNHDPNVGRVTALNYAIPAFTDRTTAKEKTIEVLLRGAVATVQQGALFALQLGNPCDPAKDPAGYQAYTVFLGFTGSLVMQGLGNAAAAYTRTDPARHRQRYMTVANEIRCQQLRDSSLNLRTACLNEVANNLSGEMPAQGFFKSDEASREHEEMRSLFGSAAKLMHADAPTNFISSGDIKDIQRLRAFFEDQKAAYDGIAPQLGDKSKGSITSARQILDFITRDLSKLEEMRKGKGKGKDQGGDQAVRPLFTDMVQRTRELSMLLFQSDLLKEDSPAQDAHIALTAALTPVLAGLRHADRRKHAQDSLKTIEAIQELAPDGSEEPGPVERLSSTLTALFQDTPLTKLVRNLTDSLDGLGRFDGPGSGFSKKHYEFLRIFGTDLTGATDEALRHVKPDQQADYLDGIRQGVEAARTIAQEKGIGSLEAQSALCTLEGQLRQKADPSPVKDGAHMTAIRRFGTPEDVTSAMPGAFAPVPRKNPREALMDDVATGIIDLSAFSRVLSDQKSLGAKELGVEEPDADMPAGVIPSVIGGAVELTNARRQIAEAVATMKDQVGVDALRALQGDKGAVSTPVETARRMLDCQAQDIKDMHHMVQALLDVGLRLGRLDGAHKMVIEEQKDAHLHPDNFNKLRVELDVLFDLQKASKILESALMSIPFNIQNPRPEVVYYGNNYGNSWHHNPNEELLKKQMVEPNVLATTAINLQEPEKIEADIRQALQNDPDDIIKAIGEITLVKLGGITDAATIDVIDAKEIASKLLVPAARAGYPLTIHHDFGKDHGDFKLGEKLMEAIKKAKKMLKQQVDPLAAGAGYGETPEAKLRICVPHLGMSPQNSGGPKLSAFWKKCLEDDDLRDVLVGDLSWSFTTKNITSDIRDQLQSISPAIAVGLDAWATAYSSFQAQGGTADKLTDLKNLDDEAALHKNASDGIADFYARTVAFVDDVVKKEMNDPVKAQKVLDLIQSHGDAGNNWLYILGNHSDRLMFGTDNLASGIKIHGEAEHMLDALALHPIYSIFRALSREAEPDGEGVVPPRNTALANVVPNLARDVFDDFFRDEDCSARRQATRVYVNTVMPTDTRRALGNIVTYIKGMDPDQRTPERTKKQLDLIEKRLFKIDPENPQSIEVGFPGADALIPLTVSLQDALENTRLTPEPDEGHVIEDVVTKLFLQTALKLSKPPAEGEQADTRPLTLHRKMIHELMTELEGQKKADELVTRLKKAKWPEGRVSEIERALTAVRKEAAAQRPVAA